MAALSWDEICKRASENNRTLICEVDKRYDKRYFKTRCNTCGEEKEERVNAFNGCDKCFVKNRTSNVEEFIKKAIIKHGNKYNYDLVDYKNSKHKVKIVCKNCKNTFEQTPNSHVLGSGCNKCAIINKTCTTEEFIKKSKKVHGNKFNYDLVEYINSYTKIKIFCNTCKNSFEQDPSQHLLMRQCVLCNKNKRLNKEKFIQQSLEIHSDKYNYDLVDFISVAKMVRIKCNRCEKIFTQTPFHHLKGGGCKICHFKERTRSLEEFIYLSKSIHGDRYNYNSVNYINKRTKVDIYCNRCEKIFTQRPFQHLKGGGCKICADDRLRDDTSSFIFKANQVHGSKFNYDLAEYIGSVIKVKIICNQCAEMFEQRPADHLQGIGCPRCKESKGEIFLKKILTENNIEFIPQHTFPGLKYINPLKCDVYVPIVNLIIEIDGDGHRKAIFGSTPEEKQKNFEDTVRNDAIKDNYAKVNGINMLRIPVDSKDKDLDFIGEIAMNCYNDLLKVKNPVQLTLDI
jgi:hypothetical protein